MAKADESPNEPTLARPARNDCLGCVLFIRQVPSIVYALSTGAHNLRRTHTPSAVSGTEAFLRSQVFGPPGIASSTSPMRSLTVSRPLGTAAQIVT
jgi:hypothetical protein